MLPNGRTFMARYERVTRRHLLANIHLERPYKQRAVSKGKQRQPPRAVQQQGRGFKSALGKVFCFVKKVGKSKAFKNIARLGLN